jgi:protein TonB
VGAGGAGLLVPGTAGGARGAAGLLPEGDGLPGRGIAGARRGEEAAAGSAPGLSGVGSAVGSAARGGPGSMVSAGEVGMLAMPAPAGVIEGPPTTFARPLGGYQLTPPYPESARRQGIQGTTLLRFEVLATGRVGRIAVDRSAGHADLDRAAIEAVQQWRFEPALRGPEPVTVWVTLPVHFELR